MKWHTKLLAVVYDGFVSGCFGIAIFWLALMVGVPGGGLAVVLLIPAICVSCLISVFVHEFGHLLAALLMGLKVSLFASWPLMLVRTPKGFRVRHFNLPSGMLGGVTAFPRSMKFLIPKRCVFLCCGPAANVFVALGALALAYDINESRFSRPGLGAMAFWNRLLIPRNGAAALLFVISMVSFFLFLASLRPFPFKRFHPDGAALLGLISNPRLMIQNWILEKLSSDLISGVRPSDLSKELINYLHTRRNDPHPANFFGYYHHLDKGRIDEAGEWIDLLVKNREHFEARNQTYALLEAAYFEARYRHNASAARQWLDQASKNGVEPQSYLRAEAATLFAEGCFREAVIIAKVALAVLPNSADKGGAIAEKEWLESILAECESKLAG
jgi:hypothetical protein